MVFWRILKHKYLSNAFDGQGAALFGGRWNSKGNKVVYCSPNKSQAIFELLYHLGSIETLESYISIPVDVPYDICIESIDENSLSKDWFKYPAPSELQMIGDRWIQQRSSCVLRVPSNTVHGENHYLVNPEHDDFPMLHIGAPESIFYFQSPFIGRPAMKEMNYRDVFICHASEDKISIVEPIVKELAKASVSYWYDRAEIKWGDSIIDKLNHGLKISRYAIVILSPSFMKKNWPKRELNAVLNLEASSGTTRVLTLMVGDDEHVDNIQTLLPLLSDKLFLRWEGDPESIVAALIDRLSTP